MGIADNEARLFHASMSGLMTKRNHLVVAFALSTDASGACPRFIGILDSGASAIRRRMVASMKKH